MENWKQREISEKFLLSLLVGIVVFSFNYFLILCWIVHFVSTQCYKYFKFKLEMDTIHPDLARQENGFRVEGSVEPNVFKVGDQCLNQSLPGYERAKLNSSQEQFTPFMSTLVAIWCITNSVIGFSGNLLTLLAIPYAAENKW